jgi:hypothetical protein
LKHRIEGQTSVWVWVENAVNEVLAMRRYRPRHRKVASRDLRHRPLVIAMSDSLHTKILQHHTQGATRYAICRLLHVGPNHVSLVLSFFGGNHHLPPSPQIEWKRDNRSKSLQRPKSSEKLNEKGISCSKTQYRQTIQILLQIGECGEF